MAQPRKSGGGSESQSEAEMHHGSGVGEHHADQAPSDVDAMGRDKRRQVVGHSYGPSRKSQVIFFIAVAALLVVVIGGYALAIAAFDQPPDSNPDEAPWSEAEAQQIPTRSPSGPCGEPGNPYPPTADSPCSTGEEPSGVTNSGEDAAAGQDAAAGETTK